MIVFWFLSTNFEVLLSFFESCHLQLDDLIFFWQIFKEGYGEVVSERERNRVGERVTVGVSMFEKQTE